jgi:acetyl esterase/lipase
MPFTEPGHTGASGLYVKTRHLTTVIDYPLAQGSASQPAAGPLPVIMFAPGFQLCADSYQPLLQTWASAGYVVAAVNFPRTNCQLKTSADEGDLINQPADVSYALKALLAVSTQPGDLFSGLLNQNEVAAAGHSDGGDTVAAMAANTCCTEPLLKAVAVLSGAVWVPMPGKYFTQATPPMLFSQGSADPTNPPWASVQLYRWDAGTRFYLNLLGADHLNPYTTTLPVEQIVGRTTLAFFDRYVLGQVPAEATMTQDGNVAGTAQLDSGGHVPSGAGASLPA